MSPVAVSIRCSSGQDPIKTFSIWSERKRVPRSLLPIPRVPLAKRRRFSFVSQHLCQSSAGLIAFSLLRDPTRHRVLLHACSDSQLCMQLCDLLVHRGRQLVHPTTERASLLPPSLEESSYLLRTGKLNASFPFPFASLLRILFIF